MGHGISGGGKPSAPSYKIRDEKLSKGIVIEDIRIHEVTREYVVPKVKFVEEEQIKLITHEEKQTKYITKEKDTLKYNVVEQDTIKYNIKEEGTVKYVPKEVECEKPVLIDKPYERPVITDKEYIIASVKDMENVRALMELIPEMSKAIDVLRKKVESLVKYKLVEEVVSAPRIEWVPTPVERIVWKDVPRERPKDDKG